MEPLWESRLRDVRPITLPQSILEKLPKKIMKTIEIWNANRDALDRESRPELLKARMALREVLDQLVPLVSHVLEEAIEIAAGEEAAVRDSLMQLAEKSGLTVQNRYRSYVKNAVRTNPLVQISRGRFDEVRRGFSELREVAALNSRAILQLEDETSKSNQ